MQLINFKADIQRQVRTFRDQWVKQNKVDPKMFPLDLSPEEWDKQFAAWCRARLSNPKWQFANT